MTDVLAGLAQLGVVPVVVLDDPATATQLGEALMDGGLATAEVTLRTPSALEAIKELAALPGMVVGAGTVVTPEQAASAVAAGAQYIVSPGFSRAVSAECAALGVPLIPGAVTATEIMAALEAGHRLVKFFPAEASGGIPTLKALSAPFADVRFVPTGGITALTLDDYLRVPSVAAVGGTWIAPRDVLVAGDYATIAARAAHAVSIVREER